MGQQLGTQPARRAKRHYIAATFYTLLAVLGLIATFAGQPSGLLATAICGLYAIYLWRGGRFVVFIF